jgi:hypothetical protein
MCLLRLLTDEDRRRFEGTGCQQTLNCDVREPEKTDCKEQIKYVCRFRPTTDQAWKEWPLCELHMQEALKKVECHME